MANVPTLLLDGVGVLAGVCSMSSFIPQIIKIARERDASGVSLGMFGVTVMAFILWTIYGALQGSWPVTISNATCLALSLVILALRVKFGDGETASR